MTPITCVKPSLPKARSLSSPTTRHGRSNIRSTSISTGIATSWNALKTKEPHGMHSLNEGQKVSYDIVADRRTGKSSAENLRAQ